MANPIQGISSIPQTTQPSSLGGATPAGDRSEFSRTLEGFINESSELQEDAQTKVAELLQGNGQDIHSAMIAVEKADLSFQLMMQVRNKIIQAYQTISQMQF